MMRRILRTLFFILFLYAVQHLFGDGFHALDGGVSVLFVDVVEGDEGDVVMVTDRADTLVDILLQLRVEDEVDLCVRIVLQEVDEHLRQGRTEIVEVGARPPIILIFAHLHVGPTVVGGAADEDDVGAAETAELCGARDERAWRIVIIVIARVADGGAGPGVVDAEFVTAVLDDLPPPRLFHAVDVGLLLVEFVEIPDLVLLRDEAFKRGVAVAEDGDGGTYLRQRRYAEE